MIITTKHISNEFGSVLNDKIKEKKISMSALGRSAGVHRTTISDYIRGKYLPQEETFRRIHQVIPDKDLYDAYFAASQPQEPRKNKQMIPSVETYNHYDAKTEPVEELPLVFNRNSLNAITLNNVKYIAYSLKHTIEYLEKEGLADLCPKDYEIYKDLYTRFVNMK